MKTENWQACSARLFSALQCLTVPSAENMHWQLKHGDAQRHSKYIYMSLSWFYSIGGMQYSIFIVVFWSKIHRSMQRISSKYALTVETCFVGMHTDIPGKPRTSSGLGARPPKWILLKILLKAFREWTSPKLNPFKGQKAKFHRHSASGGILSI